VRHWLHRRVHKNFCYFLSKERRVDFPQANARRL
jgi:hypothetical protein